MELYVDVLPLRYSGDNEIGPAMAEAAMAPRKENLVLLLFGKLHLLQNDAKVQAAIAKIRARMDPLNIIPDERLSGGFRWEIASANSRMRLV